MYSKKRETRERDTTDKQWTEMDVDIKKNDNDSFKKILDEKLSVVSTPTEETMPKINPVKWTVNNIKDYTKYYSFIYQLCN